MNSQAPIFTAPTEVSRLANQAAHYMTDLKAEAAAFRAQQPKAERYDLDIYIALLDMIIASEFMFACLERLLETSAFKGKLKTKLNNLQPDLIRIIDEDFGLLACKDESAEIMYSLQDGFKNFIQQLQIQRFAAHKPAHLAGLGQLLEKFHMMPEWLLHHNGIKIVDK